MVNRARWAAAAAALVAALALAPATGATDHGIFVDGSYSPGAQDTAMDRLLDRRLADAERTMGRRHPGSRRRTVDSKDSLQQALRGIRCTCRDTITLVMMGHGQRDRFVFAKASGSDRRLSAADLANWLEGAAVECCCKIHVVIFSCHSGSFLDELFAKDHIESVWASSREDERSYSDAQRLEDGTLQDGGDWLRGFDEDWAAAPPNTSLGDALQLSSETAEEKMPERFTDRQHPVGWRRGDHTVVAHVEKVRRREIEIHYYRPEFMRSRTRSLQREGLKAPENLAESNWITFTGRFGKPGDPVTAAGAVTTTDPPSERVLAHVENAGRQGRRRYLQVHTVRPKWQYCRRQRLFIDDRDQLPAGLQKCNWLEQTVTVVDPEEELHTGDPIRRVTPTFAVKAHVAGPINVQRGTFRAHLLEPPWLNCNNVIIQLPPGERGELRALQRCRNVSLDLDLGENADGFLPGRNLELLHRQQFATPRFDVALQAPSPLDFSLPADAVGSERAFAPRVGVTNVGGETASFELWAAIAPDEVAGEAWLGNPAAAVLIAWSDRRRVEDLEPGDTASVEFGPWRPPAEGGRFWAVFRAALEGDEHPGSDVSRLAFDLPAEAEPPVRAETARAPDIDLGTLDPRVYPFPITARNENCPGRHTFRVSFEPEVGGEWLRLVGPAELTGIGVGKDQTTAAEVDLTSGGPGERRGLLVIECLTCPPPPACTQDLQEIEIRATVAEPSAG